MKHLFNNITKWVTNFIRFIKEAKPQTLSQLVEKAETEYYEHIYPKIKKTKCLRYTLPDGRKIYVHNYQKIDKKTNRICVPEEVAKLISTAIEEKEVYRKRKYEDFYIERK